MRKNFFCIGVISIFVGICLALGWHHHQIRPLASIMPSSFEAFYSEEKQVDIYVKALSSQESKKLLGYDLLRKNVQPLQLMIQNNSPNAYSLSPNLIDLKHIDSNKIARKIQRSTLPRSIGFKILGFLFWPFMIPGSIDTLHSFYSHKLLKKDYRAKSMKDEIIPPYSTFHRILFVCKSDFNTDFTITLQGENQRQSLIFDLSTRDDAIHNA